MMHTHYKACACNGYVNKGQKLKLNKNHSDTVNHKPSPKGLSTWGKPHDPYLIQQEKMLNGTEIRVREAYSDSL